MSFPITKVLVANRGEIALRAIQVVRQCGLLSVAVYSEADRQSRHVFAADEAVCIGLASSRETYLNIDLLVHVACETGCDAVYPGYGFLSENPNFVITCEKAGLIFIGPAADTIKCMGNKVAARERALEAGIPVVGGSDQIVDSLNDAQRAASDVGYPLLVKAVAGGGGRGMRVVKNPEQFDDAFLSASQESEAAFGVRSLYLERYLTEVRHIEIQVFGDGRGQAIALGERDCSLQRRYQKLIEESPSPVVSSGIREAMSKNAVALARDIHYRGSGTIEYLFDPREEQYYFIEMNTRIQVEHPVTEVRFGIDLVEAQIKIAMGYSLSEVFELSQPTGHAIEFRINAEDSDNDFRPSPGQIECWSLPRMDGVRCDHAVYPGYQVPPYYDSLIAKVVVHAPSRPDALVKAKQFFCGFVCTGISTTQAFHQWVLEQPDFVAGQYDTNWLDRSLNSDSEGKAIV